MSTKSPWHTNDNFGTNSFGCCSSKYKGKPGEFSVDGMKAKSTSLPHTSIELILIAIRSRKAHQSSGRRNELPHGIYIYIYLYICNRHRTRDLCFFVGERIGGVGHQTDMPLTCWALVYKNNSSFQNVPEHPLYIVVNSVPHREYLGKITHRQVRGVFSFLFKQN